MKKSLVILLGVVVFAVIFTGCGKSYLSIKNDLSIPIKNISFMEESGDPSYSTTGVLYSGETSPKFGVEGGTYTVTSFSYYYGGLWAPADDTYLSNPTFDVDSPGLFSSKDVESTYVMY